MTTLNIKNVFYEKTKDCYDFSIVSFDSEKIITAKRVRRYAIVCNENKKLYMLTLCQF